MQVNQINILNFIHVVTVQFKNYSFKLWRKNTLFKNKIALTEIIVMVWI